MSTDVFGIRGEVGGPAGSSPSGNPLVAGPVETTTPFTGLRLVESCHQLATAVESKDWLSGALAGVATVADTVSMVINPIGELAGMVVGWIMEHLWPLNEWFDELTGDAGEVAGGAATWSNIATQLTQVSDDYSADVASVTGQTSSRTTTAYQNLAKDMAEHLSSAGALASAVSAGLSVASTIVQVVHDLVREAIADVVAVVVGNLIPTPKLIADISAKVSKWVGILDSKVRGVVDSVRNLSDRFRSADELLASMSRAFDDLLRGSAFGPQLALPGGGSVPRGGNGTVFSVSGGGGRGPRGRGGSSGKPAGGSSGSPTEDSGGGPTWQPNPKHDQKRPGVGAQPSNPGEALKTAVPVSPNSTRMVSADKTSGEFIVFDETFPNSGIYHGHVREWSELSNAQKAALYKAGLVTNLRNGKMA